MKKIVMIMLILVLGLTGCGIIEREESDSSKGVFNEDSNNGETNEEISNEDINKLNNELQVKEKEIENLDKIITTLTKKNLDLEEENNEYLEKIMKAEDDFNEFKEKLNHYPEFRLQSGEIEDINNYLRELNISFLKTNKELDVLYSNSKDRVIFTTTNFLNFVKSIYIWDKGNEKPILVPNSQFSIGSYKWLEEDKYIIIDSGKSAIRNKKIIDVYRKEVISEFSCISGEYHIPDTTWFILNIPDEDNQNDKFTRDLAIYNFSTNEFNIIESADNYKDCSFNIDKINNKVIIEVTYEEDSISYYSKKIIKMDDFIDKFCNQGEIKEQSNQEISNEKKDENNEELQEESLEKQNEEVQETINEEIKDEEIDETEEDNKKDINEESNEDTKEDDIIDTEQEDIKDDDIVQN